MRALIGWEGSNEALLEALLWCRRRPDAVRGAFRGGRAWRTFLGALEEVLDERHPDAGPAPRLTAVEAARLYQTIYWIARAAGTPTPETDLLHVTAAGWAVIPALVHKELHGTDMLLTEHGVYVREAYLAAARSPSSQGERFLTSRLGARPEPRRLRGGGLRLAGHRGQRSLGAGTGRGPRQDQGDPERDRRPG